MSNPTNCCCNYVLTVFGSGVIQCGTKVITIIILNTYYWMVFVCLSGHLSRSRQFEYSEGQKFYYSFGIACDETEKGGG